MLEFAIVTPLLLMLVFGMIFFGLALNTRQDLTRASAEGARAAAVAMPDENNHYQLAWDATDEAVDSFLSGGCDRGDVACLVEGPTEALCVDEPAPLAGDPVPQCVKVTITYSGDLTGNVIPFIGAVIPDELVSSSTVRINQ